MKKWFQKWRNDPRVPTVLIAVGVVLIIIGLIVVAKG